MKTRTLLLRTLTVVCTILLSGSGLTAAGSEYTYVVVLNDSAGSAQPDIPALGGEVLHQSQNRRVVRISASGIRALAAHRGVKYIQRVQVDDSLPPLPLAPRLAATAVESNASPAPTWYSGEYVYDGDGNITAIGTAANQASDGGSESYVYDSANRLVQATIDHGTTDTEKYTYDSFGNLVDTTRTASPSTPTPTSPATNRITLTGVTYDSVGNTQSEGGSLSYAYDGLNMMRAKVKSTETALYVYTADDERVGAYENGVQRWMIRDLGGKVLREWEVTGSVWVWREDHIYRNGALAAGEREPAEGGTRHFHIDHLGTPRLITDANATRIAAHDYYSFGLEKTDFRQEMVDRGTTWPEAMGFTGHERDFTGGTSIPNRNYLYYMHARYYSAVWGRFLTVDPVLDRDKALKEPQRWNRYTYVINNPLRFTDPDGRQMKPKCEVDNCPPPAPIETLLRITPANLERTAKANANKPPTISSTTGAPPTKGVVTAVVGVNANFVALGGGNAGLSLMHSNRIGTEHAAVAASGGVHTPSPRGSAGVQATVGLFRGDVADQRGMFTEANFAVGPIGVTLSFTKAGGFVGGTLSYGPSVGGGYSTSESNTVVLTGQEFLDKVGVDP